MDEKAQLILQQLESTETETRIAATRQFSDLLDPSLEVLAVSLGDSDWRVRKAAVETFFQLKSPALFIPELIKLLYHPENAGLRNSSIEILIGLGPLAVADLQREISAPDVEVRKFVIDILGEIGDARCAAGLRDSLADADINVRYATVETLGKLGSEDVVESLLELMSDPDPGLKFTILQSLSQIGGKIPTERLFLYLEDRLLRKALFDCFAKIGGAEVVPHLVKGLCDPMRQVREAALSALDKLRHSEFELIRREVSSSDVESIAVFLEEIFTGETSHLKDAALFLYGAVGSSRDLSVLLQCIGDETLRTQTLNTFSDLGEPSFTRLIKSWDGADNLWHLYLVYVGGELGFKSVLPLAIDAVDSQDPQLRNAAAMALGGLGDQQHFDFLQTLLDDEIADIQNTAAVACAAFANRHQKIVVDQISAILADSDADKRMRGVRILGMIGGAEIESLLLKAFKDSSVSVRCEAIRALGGHFSESVIAGLSFALTDESAEVRRLAVSALGQCSQEQAFSALTLAAADSDLWVRAAVMSAQKSFSGETVQKLLLQGVADPVGLVVIAALESAVIAMPTHSQPLLENALSHADEEVVKSAMNLLAQVAGSSWIKPFISTLLEHDHWDVRLHAIRSLCQSGLQEVSILLRERLVVESEVLVRQEIESAMSRLLHSDSQGC